jgi:serine/threonine protein kinase
MTEPTSASREQSPPSDPASLGASETASFPVDASEDELIHLCQCPDRKLIGTSKNVVQISDRLIIKFGWNVYEEEAKNIQAARKLVHPHIIRVPKFYRYFQRNGNGYLVMEFVPGRSPVSGDFPILAERIARILLKFRDVTKASPGPLQGGISRGILWQSDFPHFRSIQDMENWFNARLPSESKKLDLRPHKLVFNHLDIAPRNIILGPDDSICIIDWQSAGFYPQFLEIAVLRLMNEQNGLFSDLVLQHLEESLESQLVREVCVRADCIYL